MLKQLQALHRCMGRSWLSTAAPSPSLPWPQRSSCTIPVASGNCWRFTWAFSICLPFWTSSADALISFWDSFSSTHIGIWFWSLCPTAFNVHWCYPWRWFTWSCTPKCPSTSQIATLWPQAAPQGYRRTLSATRSKESKEFLSCYCFSFLDWFCTLLQRSRFSDNNPRPSSSQNYGCTFHSRWSSVTESL